LNAIIYFNKNKVKPSKVFGNGKVANKIFKYLKKNL